MHLSLLVRVWLRLHPRERRGDLIDRGRGHIYIGLIIFSQVQDLFGCGLATTVLCRLTCLCASVRAVGVCPRLNWNYSR